MADFVEVAEIIPCCMEYSDNKFLEAYYTNIGIQTEQVLEASPVVTSIIKFMDSKTG